MRENVARMEETPFDGLVFHVLAKNGDNLAWKCWGTQRFELAELQHAVDDLKATRFCRFTERFLRVNVCPGNVDWFDDAAWSVVQQNFALAARVARRGGCRGFMFDVEQYEGPLFDYRKQVRCVDKHCGDKHCGDKTFAQYQAQVRKRGRQWMEAIGGEYPEITVMLTFGYSIAMARKQPDRSQVRYGLLADFLDGMFEACPQRAKIVDAWEQAYPYQRAAQFHEAYETIKRQSLAWTAAPEQYRRHVQAGFGIWMDYDWRKHGWNTQDFAKNHFTPDALETSVRAALATSDRYVWIYTEQPRWWSNERLPKEYVEALRRARK